MVDVCLLDSAHPLLVKHCLGLDLVHDLQKLRKRHLLAARRRRLTGGRVRLANGNCPASVGADRLDGAIYRNPKGHRQATALLKRDP